MVGGLALLQRYRPSKGGPKASETSVPQAF